MDWGLARTTHVQEIPSNHTFGYTYLNDNQLFSIFLLQSSLHRRLTVAGLYRQQHFSTIFDISASHSCVDPIVRQLGVGLSLSIFPSIEQLHFSAINTKNSNMSSVGEESFVVVDKSLALLESSVLKETDDKENCAGKSIDDQPAMTDISVGHVSLSPNPKNLDTSGRSEVFIRSPCFHSTF